MYYNLRSKIRILNEKFLEGYGLPEPGLADSMFQYTIIIYRYFKNKHIQKLLDCLKYFTLDRFGYCN